MEREVKRRKEIYRGVAETEINEVEFLLRVAISQPFVFLYYSTAFAHCIIQFRAIKCESDL